MKPQFSRLLQSRTDREIVAAFRKARDEEFAVLAAEFDGLTGSIREQSRGKHLSAGRLSAHESEIARLHSELERIASNDFFGAAGRAAAFAAYARCQKELRTAQGPKATTTPSETKRGKLDVARYQGRRWVTRRNLHIDRLASAWLIKQFIDKRLTTEAQRHSGCTVYLTILGIKTTINARSLIVAVPTTTFSPSRRLRAVCTRPRIPSPEIVKVKSCI